MAFGIRTATPPVRDHSADIATNSISAPVATPDNTETRALIESIICNIDRLALDAATVMSAVNLLNSPDRAIRAEEIQRFLPAKEEQLSLMFQALSDLTNNMFQQPNVDSFVEAVRDARQAFHNFMAEEAEIGSNHARIIYAERLKIFWTRVCNSMIQLVNDTNVELRLELPLAFRQNSVVLLSLLSGVTNGLSPCINEKGQLYSPDLPQQRKWPRHNVLQNCYVECNGEKFPAFVQDASAGGLGLERLPELPRGSQVKVTMESGRVFNGIVMWSNNNRAGIRFPAPLLQTDPLLTG